jgi:hypothetical protein
MKLILESWRKYINEIGDASAESYPFKVVGRRTGPDTRLVTYGFNSEDFLYHVDFASLLGGTKEDSTWVIDFEASEIAPQVGTAGTGIFPGEFYSKKMTGEGRPLQIMSTVVNIIKDFVGNPQLNEGILHFRFTGMSKSDAVDLYSGKETQRTRLYRAFLEKNMPPGTKVEEIGTNVIAFTVPEGRKDETPA